MSNQVRRGLLPRILVLGQICLACVRGPVPAPAARPSVKVDILAVGHGDSILVVSAAGKRVLVDGGEASAAPVILAHLHERRACPLDLVLLTHPHSDHLGGLRQVIEGCGAKLFMDSGHHHESPLYQRLLEVLEKQGVALRQAEPGRQIDLGGGAVMTLLGPPRPDTEQAEQAEQAGSKDANSNSVVARLSVGGTYMLLVGDADIHEEKWLLGRGVDLRAQVLKVGHHGSRTSSSMELLRAVAPRLAVVSNWTDAPKHPHPETVERMRQVGARILETGREGTIHLELNGESVLFHTTAHPQEARLP